MACNCRNMRDDMTECELKSRIDEVQFVCVELNLYLDTHPDDVKAMNDYISYSTELMNLMQMYETQYGPLMNFGHSDTDTGSWVFSKWPWE